MGEVTFMALARELFIQGSSVSALGFFSLGYIVGITVSPSASR